MFKHQESQMLKNLTVSQLLPEFAVNFQCYFTPSTLAPFDNNLQGRIQDLKKEVAWGLWGIVTSIYFGRGEVGIWIRLAGNVKPISLFM